MVAHVVAGSSPAQIRSNRMGLNSVFCGLALFTLKCTTRADLDRHRNKLGISSWRMLRLRPFLAALDEPQCTNDAMRSDHELSAHLDSTLSDGGRIRICVA